MSTTRLEAFSDGVFAIIITIMVLELKPPENGSWQAFNGDVQRSLLMYVLSFIIVGIYWSNHHHLLHVSDRVSGAVLWANLNLLFWLSLVPWVTAWMAKGEQLETAPTACYGIVLILAAFSYRILLSALLRAQGPGSKLAAAIGSDLKGWMSLGVYAVAIPLAWPQPWLSAVCYVTVAIIWLVPDRRIEKHVH